MAAGNERYTASLIASDSAWMNGAALPTSVVRTETS